MNFDKNSLIPNYHSFMKSNKVFDAREGARKFSHEKRRNIDSCLGEVVEKSKTKFVKGPDGMSLGELMKLEVEALPESQEAEYDINLNHTSVDPNTGIASGNPYMFYYLTSIMKINEMAEYERKHREEFVKEHGTPEEMAAPVVLDPVVEKLEGKEGIVGHPVDEIQLDNKIMDYVDTDKDNLGLFQQGASDPDIEEKNDPAIISTVRATYEDEIKDDAEKTGYSKSDMASLYTYVFHKFGKDALNGEYYDSSIPVVQRGTCGFTRGIFLGDPPNGGTWVKNSKVKHFGKWFIHAYFSGRWSKYVVSPKYHAGDVVESPCYMYFYIDGPGGHDALVINQKFRDKLEPMQRPSSLVFLAWYGHIRESEIKLDYVFFLESGVVVHAGIYRENCGDAPFGMSKSERMRHGKKKRVRDDYYGCHLTPREAERSMIQSVLIDRKLVGYDLHNFLKVFFIKHSCTLDMDYPGNYLHWSKLGGYCDKIKIRGLDESMILIKEEYRTFRRELSISSDIYIKNPESTWEVGLDRFGNSKLFLTPLGLEEFLALYMNYKGGNYLSSLFVGIHFYVGWKSGRKGYDELNVYCRDKDREHVKRYLFVCGHKTVIYKLQIALALRICRSVKYQEFLSLFGSRFPYHG